MNKKIFLIALSALALIVAGTFAPSAIAHHAWESYHWVRTANPFTLKLGDSITPNWEMYLNNAVADWSTSSVLDGTVVPGRANPAGCKASYGLVEVCNYQYGENGWLGIAHIWVSNNHTVYGVVKLNDTYFNTPQFNTTEWRQLVVCHEIGHILGLGHQDANFWNAPLGSCMDYSEVPTENQHPNAHDYEMLETIYAHADTSTTTNSQISIRTSPSGFNIEELDHSKPSSWGKKIHESKKEKNGKARETIYERDLGKGKKAFTFVIWAAE